MDADFKSHFHPDYTDKNTLHSYLDHYEGILKELLFKKGIQLRVVEVGIQRGGSAVGWLKSLPFAHVWGIDCQKTVDIQHHNFTELIMNAYDEDNLSKFPKEIDFFVDDGSHAYSDLLFAVTHFPHLLSKDGVLIIEDLPDMKWYIKFLSVLPKGFRAELLDLRSDRNNRFDNMLIIIRRV